MRLISTLAAIIYLVSGSGLAAPVNVQPGTVAGYMYLPKAVTGSSASPTLPVVTENAACTATTTANTGIDSTYTKILTCNGGAWKPISVGALQTVTAGAACTASATNNIGVDSGFTKAYMCVSGTWQEYSPTAKSVQTATEGAACTASAANNVAVTADYQSLLTCRSGVWQGQGIGQGQAWVDVTASRAFSTNYTNATGKSISYSVWADSSQPGCWIDLLVNGISISRVITSDYYTAVAATNAYTSATAIVPPGATYAVIPFQGGSGFPCAPNLDRWVELR